MYGGRNTTLCNEHINDWHEFITEQSCFIYGNKVQIKLVSSVNLGEEDRALELYDDLEQQKDVAFDLSGLWLQNKRKEWIDPSPPGRESGAGPPGYRLAVILPETRRWRGA